MATPIFDKFLGDMSGLSQRICSSNLKSVSLAILEQLAFNAQKIYGGHLTLATTPIRKIFKGHVWTVPKNMPAKFEVRSFNRVGIISTYFQKIGVTLPWSRPLFEKFLRCHVQTVPGNMPAKSKVRTSFERIDSRQRSLVQTQNRWTQVRQPEHSRRQSLI